MNIEKALELLKQGEKVAREGWNGKGMWLKLIEADDCRIFCADIEENSPWIGMKTADNKFVFWSAIQADVLAEDWILVTS